MYRRIVALLSALVLFAQPASALANTSEQRDFSILLDGKEAGQWRVIITVQDDGTTVVAASAQLKVNQLIFKYSFSMDATEWWKDGKLTGLQASTVENGKRTEVIASSDGSRLKMRVNGQDRTGSGEAWVSTFWKLADPRFHNKSIPVLDADSGKEYTAQLRYIGTEQLTLLNQPQDCYHFRVLGGTSPVDVWFDRYHRLVRQEFTESGHRTIVQLIGLKR
jgi:hypothetical protein